MRRSYLRDYAALLVLALYLCLQHSVAFAQPNESWSVQSTAIDCSGTSAYSTDNPSTPTHPNSGDVCQSYDSDIYENRDTGTDGWGGADITNFRVGYDATYFYFRFETVSSWKNSGYSSQEGNGEGRGYHVEIDNDYAAAGDDRPDFWVEYSPTSSHVGTTWVATGGDKAKWYEDDNDDVGSTNLLTSDYSCSCDGFNASPTVNSTDIYVRITTVASIDVVEIAIDKTLISSPAEIRSNAWIGQLGKLDNSKMRHHDSNDTGTLSSYAMDNVFDSDTTKWVESGASAVPVTLSFFLATRSDETSGAQGRVDFQWLTAIEVGNVGFNL